MLLRQLHEKFPSLLSGPESPRIGFGVYARSVRNELLRLKRHPEYALASPKGGKPKQEDPSGENAEGSNFALACKRVYRRVADWMASQKEKITSKRSGK